MEINPKAELFERTPIPKAVMTLSVPTIIGSLVMVIYNLVDTWFVGLLNDPVQNAAVTLAAPVLLAFNAINNLFGVGASSMMGRALGRKDYDTVRRTTAFGVWAAFLCAVLFGLGYTLFSGRLLSVLGADADNRSATADYLYWTVTLGAIPSILNVVLAYLVRTEGASLHASIGGMSGCVLNMILDPLFILPWGLNMGAAGAGCATFISNCAACIYFIVFLLSRKKKTFVCLNPKYALPQKAIVLGVFAVGIPASIQNLLNVIGATVLNNYTSVYGSEAVSAMGIANKIYMIPMYVVMGLSQGMMPLISYNYGSRNVDRMRKALGFSLKISMMFLAAVAVMYYIFAGGLMELFIKNEEIIAYGTRFLRGMSLGIPFLCLDFICIGTFQSCGKGLISLVFAFARKVLLEIPALIILNYVFPLYGLAYAQFATEAILSVAAVIMVLRLFRFLQRESGPAPS